MNTQPFGSGLSARVAGGSPNGYGIEVPKA
jgi:hypothetical protein